MADFESISVHSTKGTTNIVNLSSEVVIDKISAKYYNPYISLDFKTTPRVQLKNIILNYSSSIASDQTYLLCSGETCCNSASIYLNPGCSRCPLEGRDDFYTCKDFIYKGELVYVDYSPDGKSCDFTWRINRITHRDNSEVHVSHRGVIHSHYEDHTIRATFTTARGEFRTIELGTCVFNN